MNIASTFKTKPDAYISHVLYFESAKGFKWVFHPDGRWLYGSLENPLSTGASEKSFTSSLLTDYHLKCKIKNFLNLQITIWPTGFLREQGEHAAEINNTVYFTNVQCTNVIIVCKTCFTVNKMFEQRTFHVLYKIFRLGLNAKAWFKPY